MRRTLATQMLDDDSSPATDRVMRAYWLAPRTSRAATVTSLLNSSSVAEAPTASAKRLTAPK